jgi:hypothetical protein
MQNVRVDSLADCATAARAENPGADEMIGCASAFFTFCITQQQIVGKKAVTYDASGKK